MAHIDAKPEFEAPVRPEIGDLESAGLRVTARANLIPRLQLLWSEKQLLGRAAFLGLIFGLLLAFLLPQRFDSTTRIMPPDQQPATSGLAMVASMISKAGPSLGALGSDLLGMKTTGALFIGILHSRTLQDRLVERFDLRKVYWVRYQVDARKKLDENTLIAEDRKSGIISVTVTDRDPNRAAAIAQAYVEELDRLAAQLSTSAAHRERVFLEERLKVVKHDLDQAAQAFSLFASKNVALDIKEQSKAMMDAAATLMGQLIAAESELKGLEEIYTPNNVRVRAVQGRIAELRKQLKDMGGSEDTNAVSPGVGGDTPYPTIRKLPLLGVKYADLYRQTKIQETIYETLTQEYELAKVQEAKETPSVKVLDVGAVPEKKSFPPRLLVTFGSMVLALAGACSWVFARRRWHETDPGDPGKVLAIEVFHTVNASMPWSPPNGSRFQATTHRVWTKLFRRDDEK